MRYFLGHFKKCWADEFDYECAFLVTEKQLNDSIDELQPYFDKEVSYYFGTNEGWDEVTVKELFDCTKVVELNQITFELAKTIIDTHCVPFHDDVLRFIEENEEDI